jgi:predicted DNA-binding transcriptional regulator AlpA
MMNREFLRSNDAANYLGVSEHLLSKWRHYKEGPQYIKAGPRIILYEKADLEKWVRNQKINPTESKDN